VRFVFASVINFIMLLLSLVCCCQSTGPGVSMIPGSLHSIDGRSCGKCGQ